MSRKRCGLRPCPVKWAAGGGQERGHLGRAEGPTDRKGETPTCKGNSPAEVRKLTEGQGTQTPCGSEAAGQRTPGSEPQPDPVSGTRVGTQPHASRGHPLRTRRPRTSSLCGFSGAARWGRAVSPRADRPEQGSPQHQKAKEKQHIGQQLLWGTHPGTGPAVTLLELTPGDCLCLGFSPKVTPLRSSRTGVCHTSVPPANKYIKPFGRSRGRAEPGPLGGAAGAERSVGAKPGGRNQATSGAEAVASSARGPAAAGGLTGVCRAQRGGGRGPTLCDRGHGFGFCSLCVVWKTLERVR